jgi:hypothetical protein
MRFGRGPIGCRSPSQSAHLIPDSPPVAHFPKPAAHYAVVFAKDRRPARFVHDQIERPNQPDLPRIDLPHRRQTRCCGLTVAPIPGTLVPGARFAQWRQARRAIHEIELEPLYAHTRRMFALAITECEIAITPASPPPLHRVGAAFPVRRPARPYRHGPISRGLSPGAGCAHHYFKLISTAPAERIKRAVKRIRSDDSMLFDNALCSGSVRPSGRRREFRQRIPQSNLKEP